MRIFLAFALLVFSAAGFAEEKKITSVVNLYGVTFQYGIAPWVDTTKNPLEQVKPYRHQQGNDFILEFIPADETFEDWKTIFAISATRNNRTVPVGLWKDYSLEGLRKHCERYEEKTLVESETVALVQVFCPKVVGAPIKGYGGRMGEIGLFAFMVHDKILINHHIEWRGHSFNTKYPNKWPVQQGEIDKAIELLKSAKAFTPQLVVSFDKE